MLPTSILTTNSRRREVEESLNNVAYRKIKDKIIALALPPASLIDEADLAKELGIGLTPVRQALRRLALENLVVILPRRGTMVADLNFSDLQKIFEMRLELEALAAQQAATRATPDQLNEMENLLAEAQALLTGHDNQQLIALDRAIHALIARCAHNEFLEQTLDWLYCHVLRLWHISLHQMDVLSEATDEHRQILAALKTGNGERAGLIMRAHVQHFQTSFQRTFQPEQSTPERWSTTPLGLEEARSSEHKNGIHPSLRLRDPMRSL